ncbi:Rv3654c family TadE-like protein [Streptomyces formicae]
MRGARWRGAGRDRGARWRGAGRDRGAATVWVVVVMAALCVVCGAVLAMSQAIVARHRAGGAADLAALAAADRWGEGRDGACDAAGRVAAAQATRMVRCVVRGQVSEVTVSAEAGPFVTEVGARAGPAGPVGADEVVGSVESVRPGARPTRQPSPVRP